MADVPDYTKDSNFNDNFTVKTSPVNDFEYTDNIEFDQMFDDVAQRKTLAAPANTGQDIFGRIESNKQNGDEGYWALILPDGFAAIFIQTFVGGAGGGGTAFSFGNIQELPGAAPGGATQFYIPGYISPTAAFSGEFDIGGTFEEWNTIYLVNAPVVSSDGRFKEDVKDIEDGLTKVLKLKPVSFKRKGSDDVHLGFIAQDVKEVVPEAIVGSEETKYGMKYESLIPVLVSAIQALEKRVLELEKGKQ